MIRDAKGGELSFFDAPTTKSDDTRYKGLIKEVKPNSISTAFDTFLVIDGKVSYQVHWERTIEKKGDTWGQAAYTEIWGKKVDRLPADELPEWALSDNLYAGFGTYKSKDGPGELLYVQNPISAEVRSKWIADYFKTTDKEKINAVLKMKYDPSGNFPKLTERVN